MEWPRFDEIRWDIEEFFRCIAKASNNLCSGVRGCSNMAGTKSFNRRTNSDSSSFNTYPSNLPTYLLLMGFELLL